MAVTLDSRPAVVARRPAPARRALDPLFWLAAGGSSLLAFGVRGPVSAAVLAIAVVVFPGVLVVDALRPTGAGERAATVIALSTVGWMLIAHALLTLQWWHPAPVGAVALATFAALRLAGSGRENRRAPAIDWHRAAHPQVAVSAVVLALWWWSVRDLDVTDIGLLGLVGVAPVTWFVALAVATVGAAWAATAPRTSVYRLIVAVAPLLVVVYGTIAASTSTVRYPWAYKHIGVIRLLDETGRLHPDVDIYNTFSGFFGLLALVRGATGVDPSSYAPWAQMVGEAFVLLAVGYLVHRVTGSVRVTSLAVVLYLLTNWVGQNYFAAQTMASYLSLVTLGMIWSWFRRDRSGSDTIAVAADAPAVALAVAPAVDARRRLAVAAVFLGLLMVHPLTPVVVVGAVCAAFVIGWVRDKWLLGALFVVGSLWVIRAIAYFAAQDFDLGFGGSLTANASGNTAFSNAPSAAMFITVVTRYFSLIVWVLAAVGGVVACWAKRRIGLLVVLALIPFGIPVVQSYGGEAIYRVYLYSLPLMAALTAWGVVSTAPVERRERLPQPTVLASVLCLALAAGFVVVHYGRERINQVEPSEVAMDAYIAAMATGPGILAQFSSGYPAQSAASYPHLQVTDTYTPYVAEMLGPTTVLPPPAALDPVADDLVALTPGTAYVVVSPGMIDSIAIGGTFPVTSSTDATRFLLANQRFRLVTRIGDTFLLEVLR